MFYKRKRFTKDDELSTECGKSVEIICQWTLRDESEIRSNQIC